MFPKSGTCSYRTTVQWGVTEDPQALLGAAICPSNDLYTEKTTSLDDVLKNRPVILENAPQCGHSNDSARRQVFGAGLPQKCWVPQCSVAGVHDDNSGTVISITWLEVLGSLPRGRVMILPPLLLCNRGKPL